MTHKPRTRLGASCACVSIISYAYVHMIQKVKLTQVGPYNTSSRGREAERSKCGYATALSRVHRCTFPPSVRRTATSCRAFLKQLTKRSAPFPHLSRRTPLPSHTACAHGAQRLSPHFSPQLSQRTHHECEATTKHCNPPLSFLVSRLHLILFARLCLTITRHPPISVSLATTTKLSQLSQTSTFGYIKHNSKKNTKTHCANKKKSTQKMHTTQTHAKKLSKKKKRTTNLPSPPQPPHAVHPSPFMFSHQVHVGE